MNNDALIAALGLDAVAAVQGYRLAVFSEAQQRGVSLVSEALSDVVSISSGVCIVIDPIDIRLAFTGDGVEQITAGASLTWNPAQGWCFIPPGGMPARFYAGPAATPLDLAPEATASARLGERPSGRREHVTQWRRPRRRPGRAAPAARLHRPDPPGAPLRQLRAGQRAQPDTQHDWRITPNVVRAPRGGNHMPLPPHEEKILAAIEDDLAGKDPRLATILTSAPFTRPTQRLLSIPLRLVAVLVAGLILLAALHTLAGGLHPLATAALTCVVATAWLTHATRAMRDRPLARMTDRSTGQVDDTATS
jgi:hypothetical protein